MKKFLIAISVTILLTSCAVGPDHASPKIEVSGKWQAFIRASKKAKLAGWWNNFNDKTLNQLVDMSFEQNLSNKATMARLNQARANYGIEVSSLFPTLNANAAANRVGLSSNGASASGARYNSYTASFDASWELDIFGGKYRAKEAAKADIEAKTASLRNTTVSMLSEIAINYIQLRTYQKHLDIARKKIENQYTIYKVVSLEKKSGISSAFDVLQSQIELENTRTALPQIKTQITQAKNRITTLLGQQPGALDKLLNKRSKIPNSNIKVVIGIPADMLRSRPDVNKAERELAYATAKIGVKKAELYPSLALGGSIGLESIKHNTLFNAASKSFGLSSVVIWNIFDAGRISKEIVFQKMLKEEAFINYQLAVLNALEETENSITAYTNDKIRTQNFDKAYKAADKSHDITLSRHQNGLIDLIELKRSEQSKLTSEEALATSKGQSAANLVKLYKALGGGWESFGKK